MFGFDQADGLRKMVLGTMRRKEACRGRIISISSGKGGVGKTFISLNLSIVLGAMKMKTLIFDADLGLANVDIMLGINPARNLEDYIRGGIPLEDLLMDIAPGVSLISGANGIWELANMVRTERERLMGAIEGLRDMFDVIIVDTAAGIDEHVMDFNLMADDLILVITPDPTSLTDGYAVAKLIARGKERPNIHLLVNMAEVEEAKIVSDTFLRVVKAFLGVDVVPLGFIPFDKEVERAVRRQIPLALNGRRSQALESIERIAARLIGRG